MAGINAGKYRSRVVIEQPTRSLNDIGEPIASDWTEYITRFGAIEPSAGREFVAAMQVVPELRGIIRLRSDSLTRAITPAMRLTYGDRTFDIEAVYDETESRREVVIWFRELVAT